VTGVAELRHALDRVAFAEKLGIVPDSWQEALLRSDSKRVLLNVSRQAGKSTVAAIIALHRALYYPGSLVLCLAPALRQSQELFQKIGAFYTNLDEPMKKYGERRLSLELTNDSRIIALPGSERTVRGFSGVNLLVVDEAARVDDDLYRSIRPMLAVSGGAILMLSTPFGTRGSFYEAWTSAASSGWQCYEVPATEVPRISSEFLEEERRALGTWWFEQEYMGRFMDSQFSVFRGEDVDAAVKTDLPPLFAATL
jgi:hypothetical protein